MTTTAGVSSRHLEAYRQFQEASHALSTQREENELQEQQLREREERLKAKDLELQNSILKFARFVEENTQKRKRLAGKVVEEKAAEEAARSRREVVLNHVRQAKEAVSTLQSQLKDVQRYQSFLVSAAEHSNGLFSGPEAIMDRYQTFNEISGSLARERTGILETEENLCQERAAIVLDERQSREQAYCQLLEVELACDQAARQAQTLQRGITSFGVYEDHQGTKLSQEAEDDSNWQAAMALADMYNQVLARSRLGHLAGATPSVQQSAIERFIADMKVALAEQGSKDG